MRNIEFQSYSSSFLLQPYPFVFFLNLHRKISISKNRSKPSSITTSMKFFGRKIETKQKLEWKSNQKAKPHQSGCWSASIFTNVLEKRISRCHLRTSVKFAPVEVRTSLGERGARLGEDREIRKKIEEEMNVELQYIKVLGEILFMMCEHFRGL